jgi:hypothetical protein
MVSDDRGYSTRKRGEGEEAYTDRGECCEGNTAVCAFHTKCRILSHLHFAAFRRVGPAGMERRESSRGHAIPSSTMSSQGEV